MPIQVFAATLSESIFSFFERGGIFIYPLILCSIAGVAAIAYKFLTLTRSRILPAELSGKMLTGEIQASDIEESKSVLARLGQAMIDGQGLSEEKRVRRVEAAAHEEIIGMQSGIGVLDVVITVAPLLGLLGTASGLVVIFQGLGETTDHLAIAQGIAQALNTTIFGLAIAVPCVIAHSYFSRKIERITASLESIMSLYMAGPGGDLDR